MCLFAFMILFLGVYVPDVLLVGDALHDVADTLEGGQHGVVHVVVAVLSVTPEAVEIGQGVEKRLDLV